MGYCSITGIMRSQDFYMRRQEQESARLVQFLLVSLEGGVFCIVLGATQTAGFAQGRRVLQRTGRHTLRRDRL